MSPAKARVRAALLLGASAVSLGEAVAILILVAVGTFRTAFLLPAATFTAGGLSWLIAGLVCRKQGAE